MAQSFDFPIKNAVQPNKGAASDGFVTRIREQGSDVVITADPDDLAVIHDTQAMSVFHLTNTGPAAATDLDLKVTARGVKFLLADVSTSQGACAIPRSERAFTCRLGTLYPGNAIGVQVMFKPIEPGTLRLAGQVRYRGRELQRDDNQVDVKVAVR